MKKILLSLFALIGMAETISAQSVEVKDVEALPGETVQASLVFTCPSGVYTGMEIGVQFPEDLKFDVRVPDPNNEEDTYTAVTGFDGLLVYKFENAKVSYSASGTRKFSTATVNVEFTVDAAAELKDYEVTVTGMLQGPGETGSIRTEIEPYTFLVKVVNVHSVILDENSTEAPAAAEGVNVTVKRTINANEWGTICLPFEMTEAQVKAAFGEGVELAEYQDFETEYDENDEPISLDVIFAPATAIEANYPYIIKVAEKVTEFKVENVNITPEDAIVETDNGKSGRQRQVYSSFIGTYVAGTEMPYEAGERSVFLSGGKFYYATSATKPLKGYRAYFWFVDEIATVPASRISISFNSTTGIKNVNQMNDGEYYNLNGVRVETPSKGIYIKDGKKVVVK